MIRFKAETAGPTRQSAHSAAQAVRTLRTYHIVDALQLVEVPEGRVTAAVAAYKNNPNVLYAEPDYFYKLAEIPDDADFAKLWGHRDRFEPVDVGGTAGKGPGTWRMV